MKKIIVCLLLLSGMYGCSTNTQEKNKNIDEMKIPHTIDLSPEDGADSVEREGDHSKSPYYTSLDYYNMKSNDNLTILSNFKTIQQTSEWSCGVTSALMVLEYYGLLGDHNEETLAAFRDNKLAPEATSLKSIINIFENTGDFNITSTYDFDDESKYEHINLEMIQDYLKDGIPVIIAWNDWGGHWQVIIGYDTMGTETYQDDVLIMADPYDTTDHNQDGYVIYPAERFYYNWTMFDFFESHYGIDERDLLFIAVNPK
jgi:ABC-type bacteriocin/lantibiotic exporters, contain an N-terminal double-glycine peptidase domain